MSVDDTNSNRASSAWWPLRGRRALDLAAAFLFVSSCAVPAIAAWLDPTHASASVRAEQRTPASFPEVPSTPREAARWPREFKAWYDDHLGLRGVILEARSRLLFHGLGLCPSKSAVIGPDGWLWYANEHSLDAWRGARPYWPFHVEDWARVFRDRAAWCAARGIVYVAALAPNKMEIYPERVPALYEKIGPSRYEQITQALSSGSPPWFVDLGRVLAEARRGDGPSDFVYSRRGTHWTARAALLGGAALLERARAQGAEVEVPAMKDFEFRPMPFDDDGWTGTLHLPDMEFEVQPCLAKNLTRRWRPTADLDALPKRVETMTGVPELPRMWMSHDSFGSVLRMILAPYFSRVVCDWNSLGQFDPRAMVEFAPAIVLDLHTERQIFQRAPDRVASIDEAECASRYDRAGPPLWSLARSVDRVRAHDRLECRVEGGGLALRARGWGSFVEWPDADLSGPGTPILRLEIEAEHAANLYVQWQVQDRPGWALAPAVKLPHPRGSSVLWAEILDAHARGPLRISVEVGAGLVHVRAAEVRSAGW